MGTLVTIGDHDSWQYKHFGCVTPKQLEHLVESLGGIEVIKKDLNIIDGYDELDEVSQEKIEEALRDGHVPDKDWRHVSFFSPSLVEELSSICTALVSK